MIVRVPDEGGQTPDPLTVVLLPGRPAGPDTFWVRGVSTEDVSDGHGILVELPGIFEVVGTKRYPTALGGSSTIPEKVLFPIRSGNEAPPGRQLA